MLKQFDWSLRMEIYWTSARVWVWKTKHDYHQWFFE